jgi:hypothetical protein
VDELSSLVDSLLEVDDDSGPAVSSTVASDVEMVTVTVVVGVVVSVTLLELSSPRLVVSSLPLSPASPAAKSVRPHAASESASATATRTQMDIPWSVSSRP